MVPKGEEQAPPPKKEKDKGEVQLNRARLIVQVPAGAKLFIDDQPMTSTSANRTFVTPVLQPGRTYYYEIRAEVVRDGRTVSENQRVILRPGEIARATFTNLAQPASATAQASNEQ
ncbi:MAG: TIGR03000 domain-containing protein [Planctomycetes bacterium]|nr:TIGR03000 domain-containing protein [Planctomycetota bacterium]